MHMFLVQFFELDPIKPILNIRRGGQVEYGLGGAPHVGSEDVQTLLCTCLQVNFPC